MPCAWFLSLMLFMLIFILEPMEQYFNLVKDNKKCMSRVHKVLRIRQDKTTIFLTLPERSTWVVAKEAIAEKLGVERKEVDFCLSVDAKKGVQNQDFIDADFCYLTVKRNGKWSKPAFTPFSQAPAGEEPTIPQSLADFVIANKNTVLEK